MRVKVDLSGMKELEENLKKLSDKKTHDAFMQKETKVLGNDLMAKCIINTPVDTGSLRRNWRVDSQKDTSQGQEIKVENDLFYAGYVNDGHRIMKNGKMVGMYEGQHFLEKSVEQFEQGMPGLIGKDLENYIEEVLNGKN